MSEAGKEKQAAPLTVAVCGVKNSGKTTCIERLVKSLTECGYQIAVIKHDGHDFQADVPGTDSHRIQQAGAFGTAVFSDSRVLVYKKTKTEWNDLVKCFPESDLILVEGLKDTELLKFEIIRQGVSREPVSNPKGRLGILTDIPGFSCGSESVINLNDTAALAGRLEIMMRSEQKKE